MRNEEEWLTEVPEPPQKVRDDPLKLKVWNDYWEEVIRQQEEERQQDQRNRRTR